MYRNNLQLGDSINTFDPAIALRGEYGTFKVTTPGGEELLITCKPGHSISNVQWYDHKDKRPFTLTKISEPVVGEEMPLGKTA